MVEAETQLSDLEDGLLSRIEQSSGYLNGIADSDPELGVQLADDSQTNEREICDSSWNALPHGEHIWNVVLRQDVVGPFARCANRKRCCSNVIATHS